MKIGLSAGHSSHPENGERIRFEHDICRQVVQCLDTLLSWAGHEVQLATPDSYFLPNDEALTSRIYNFNFHKPQIALDIHLNRGGGRYSTAIYYDTETGLSHQGRRLAGCITDQFSAAFPWKTIGPRGQRYFGRNLAFLRETKMPSIITEVGFKDNQEQIGILQSDEGIIQHATAIFQGIQRYAWS